MNNSLYKLVIYTLCFLSLINFIRMGVANAFIGKMCDFQYYYRAAKVIRQGGCLYPGVRFGSEKEIRKRQGAFGYLYPPLLSVLLSPLGKFNYKKAENIWASINIFFSIMILILLLKLSEKKFRGFVFILFANFYPLHLSLGTGQVNVFVGFLVMLFIYFCNTNKQTLSAIPLAIAVGLKISPVVLSVYYILSKNLKAMLLFIFSLIVITSFTVYMAGLNNHLLYINEMLPNLAGGTEEGCNITFNGFLLRLTKIFPALFTNKNARIVLKGIEYLFYLTILSILSFIYIKRTSETNSQLFLALLPPFMFLIAPLALEHHFIPLLISFVLIMKNVLNSTKYSALFALSYGIIGGQYNFYNYIFRKGLLLFVASTKFYGMLLLFGTIVSLIVKEYYLKNSTFKEV